jgi:CAAX prenyl protease-like protein
VLFMAFLVLESSLRWVSGMVSAIAPDRPELFLWLYPVRTAVVLGALVFYGPAYQELRGKVCADWGEALFIAGIATLVYYAWVCLDWPWAMLGQSAGYNPLQVGGGTGVILAGLRLVGAVVVVPVMEELFWRSSLLRHLVAALFTSVRLGTFTPFSFGATVVLFGLEH